jgi:hypothetical protein
MVASASNAYYESGGSVASRVSWGALLAGAAVGIAVYSVLAMVGVAVGLSVTDDASSDTVSVGAGVWAFVSLLIAMFFAGWVTTQCTVGENQTEAVLYGVIVWAVTSSILFWSAAAGLSLGYSAILDRHRLNDREASAALDPVRATATQPQVDPAARDRMQAAAWWTLGSTVLSLISAIAGALLGPYEFVARREYRRDALTSTRTGSADLTRVERREPSRSTGEDPQM